MTIQLYAQPYDLFAAGFYFGDYETYKDKIRNIRNDFGDRVEEFELQFIDGKAIDCALAQAWGLCSSILDRLFDVADQWCDDQKIRFIIAVQECGYDFDPDTVDPFDFDIDIYELDSMRELAEQFIDEGWFGEIPTYLQNYIDYDAIARDLSYDYSQTTIAGKNIIYRCG